MEIKTLYELMQLYGTDRPNDERWVSVESLEKWIDSIHDGLFSDRNWKKILKQQLKKTKT